eukprot:1732192-Amphidinium_carterae.1
MLPEVPSVEPEAGRAYTAASGARIADEGFKQFLVRTSSGPRALTMRLGGVTKPLLSVADMVDQGHTVTFSRQGSCVTHDKTGAVLSLTRRNRVFEVDLPVIGPVQGEQRMHLNPLEHEVVSRPGVEHEVVSRP